MFRLLVVACLAYVTVALPFKAELNSKWKAFKSTYNKGYSHGDEGNRRHAWEENVKYIEAHNLEADSGTKTFRLGVNEYADMTKEEFVHVMNGYAKQPLLANTVSKCDHYINNVQLSALSKSVNWMTKGYVTDIKNQGQCGSCWAFSATGSLEGQHFRKTGKLEPLAESNLVDCSEAEGNDGCNGGLMDQAFTYIIKNDGIATESSYPYKPRTRECAFKSADVGATAVSCMYIEEFSESDLQKAVATEGPISVAIDASQSSFQLYKSGVYEEPACSTTSMDHGVLAVGYGTMDGKDYWLVKNSWGKSWGDEGYIYMARNYNNMCGIATMASFPTVK